MFGYDAKLAVPFSGIGLGAVFSRSRDETLLVRNPHLTWNPSGELIFVIETVWNLRFRTLENPKP